MKRVGIFVEFNYEDLEVNVFIIQFILLLQPNHIYEIKDNIGSSAHYQANAM